MTCIHIGTGIVCVNPWGRLKVGNRYVWVDFHPYCGPAFFTDAGMTKTYDPVDEGDPVWPEFTKWLDKHRAAKEKQAAKRALHNAKVSGDPRSGASTALTGSANSTGERDDL